MPPRVGFTYLIPAFSLRPQAGPSGLSFLLVIPLQRITKYPLLLQKILENTLPDASAYSVLQRATSALQDVNANINEYKRRKEVGKDLVNLEDTSVSILPVIKSSYQIGFTNEGQVVAHVTTSPEVSGLWVGFDQVAGSVSL